MYFSKTIAKNGCRCELLHTFTSARRLWVKFRSCSKKISNEGYRLIITVDNGIGSYEEVELAKSLGMDVIITDHHEPREMLPNAYAIIDPKQNDCNYPFKNLAGVGVALKACSCID